jgi:hypothetical protein
VCGYYILNILIYPFQSAITDGAVLVSSPFRKEWKIFFTFSVLESYKANLGVQKKTPRNIFS